MFQEKKWLACVHVLPVFGCGDVKYARTLVPPTRFVLLKYPGDVLHDVKTFQTSSSSSSSSFCVFFTFALTQSEISQRGLLAVLPGSAGRLALPPTGRVREANDIQNAPRERGEGHASRRGGQGEEKANIIQSSPWLALGVEISVVPPSFCDLQQYLRKWCLLSHCFRTIHGASQVDLSIGVQKRYLVFCRALPPPSDELNLITFIGVTLRWLAFLDSLGTTCRPFDRPSRAVMWCRPVRGTSTPPPLTVSHRTPLFSSPVLSFSVWWGMIWSGVVWCGMVGFGRLRWRSSAACYSWLRLIPARSTSLSSIRSYRRGLRG